MSQEPVTVEVPFIHVIPKEICVNNTSDQDIVILSKPTKSLGIMQENVCKAQSICNISANSSLEIQVFALHDSERKKPCVFYSNLQSGTTITIKPKHLQ